MPTLRELGYKVGSPTLYGIAAPKGTPREVVDALYGAAKKAVEKYGEPIAASMSTLGAEVRLLGPDEYADYLKRQQQLFAIADQQTGFDKCMSDNPFGNRRGCGSGGEVERRHEAARALVWLRKTVSSVRPDLVS